LRAKNFEREMNEKGFGDMVDFLNSLFQNGISLNNNLSGQILEFEIPADGSEIQVPHKLGVVPKYRIVLRQDANAILIDGEETWTDKFVTFKSADLSLLYKRTTSVTFPGGTYNLITSGTARTVIPPTACTIGETDENITGDVRDTKFTVLLLRD
jgi:hypothetical protein